METGRFPMTRTRKSRGLYYGVLIAAVSIAVTLTGTKHHAGGAQNPAEATGPLISRGYTDAPAGMAAVAAAPEGGSVLSELRVKPGQAVRRNEVIGVLSNYSTAEAEIRKVEASLRKLHVQQETMRTGFRIADIAEQEIAVNTLSERHRLKVLVLSRSSLPADQKELQEAISRRQLERERKRLRLKQEKLRTDLARAELDRKIILAHLENARLYLETTLVRAPVDGIVVDVLTHPGEIVSPKGIGRVVDLSKIRIFADVDEIHLRSLKVGGAVEFTFRGSNSVHKGTVSRLPLTVKRTKQSEADFGESNVRHAEIEVVPDDPASIPQMLGREARVVFQ